MNKKNLLIISLMVLVVILFTIIGVNFLAGASCTKTTNLNLPKAQNQLTGIKWTWGATLMDKDENILPRDRDAFSITFNEDGSFNGTTDCNNFFGQYEREENKISFGPIAMTRMYCEGSQETEFTNTLSEVEQVIFDVKGNLFLKFNLGSIMFQDKESEYNMQKWELIKQAINECAVKQAGQTHGRQVSVELKDGREIEAFEPALDDLFDIVDYAKEQCGEINLWTE